MSADQAIAFARAQIGKPYVFGATGPDSYDCSGLVLKAWGAGGVSLGRTTFQQIFDGVEVTRASLAPGDLLFPDAGHVQLYIGNNQVIEAPHEGLDVMVSQVTGFWRARRVGAPATVDPTGTVTGGGGSIPVTNPLNPATWPGLKQLNAIATTVNSGKFWSRIGMGSLAVLLIAFGIVFLARHQIESATTTVGKAVI